MKSILYPFAFNSNDRLVSIHEAEKGEAYLCVGCKEMMTPKKGKINRAHFAHKQAGLCADPDNALHKLAQALIVQSINDSADGKEDYYLGYTCYECKEEIAYNIASQVIEAKQEKSIIAGVRSDIVVYRKEKDPVAIEVVVTHDLEPATENSYKDSNVPVFLIHPEWEQLDRLNIAVIAGKTINIGDSMCKEYVDRYKEMEKRQNYVSNTVSYLLKPMINRTPWISNRLPFTPWRKDKFGNPMYSNIRKQVFINALVLTELGFIQTKTKPYLFWIKLPNNGLVFANFGSTEEVPIWKNPAALIHWKLNQYDDDMEMGIVKEVIQRCRKAGIEVRVSFWNGIYDPWSEQKPAMPLTNVNDAIISQLLRH